MLHVKYSVQCPAHHKWMLGDGTVFSSERKCDRRAIITLAVSCRDTGLAPRLSGPQTAAGAILSF